MNVKKRFVNAITGKAVDRVPILLKGFQLLTRREQISDIEDPGRREIAERIYPLQHAFHVHPTGINRYFATPPRFISEVATRRDSSGNTVSEYRIDTPKGELRYEIGRNDRTDTSWHVSHPVSSREDLEAIRSIPFAVPSEFAPLATDALPTDPDQRTLAMVRISSPVVCVADTMPFESFLELCVADLDLVEALTRECHRRIKAILEHQLSRRTVDMVWIGGSEYVTPPMASPRIYEALVQAFEGELIATAHDAGALVWVHCHGRVSSALASVEANGADLFEPVEPPPDGDVMFRDAKERVRGTLALGGNIESRIVEEGSKEEVIDAVRAAFEGPTEGMVLIDSAGPVRRYTPRMVENYHTLVDVWEKLSVGSQSR